MASSPFTFRNYAAGIDQLEIDDEDDLARIDELDKARWAATSAPLEQLFCDPAFLAYVDTDLNKRIRVDELKEARRWAWAHLKSRANLVKRSDVLVLSDLDPANEEANKIRSLAVRLLEQLGAAARDRIDLGQVRQFRDSYSRRFPNGDGVVTVGQITDAAVAALADTVVKSTGGGKDMSGDAGVRAADLDTWIERAKAYIAWEGQRAGVMVLGNATADAADHVAALAPKVAQYFAQCALVALEVNATTRLQATPEELAKLDVTDPAAIDAWLARSPVARPGMEPVLHLDGPLNPKFAPALQRLAAEIGPKVLGREGPLAALTAADFAAIDGAFAPFRAWRSSRPPGIPDDATAAGLAEILAGPNVDKLRALCAEDLGVADELLEFNDLEKLVLYQRWLMELANNFVSFPNLFIPTERALFEMGTLILDGRKLSLCVRVTDRAAHKKIAETSLMFLAYVEINRREGDVVRTDQIAAAVTAGMRGGIEIGKRGVFYDRDEKEWDAIVVDIISNPISIWEAMVAPFVRIRNAVAERVTSMIGAKATALESQAGDTAQSGVTKAQDTATTAATAPAPDAPAPAPPPKDGSSMQNLLIGGSLAFAALGSSVAFIVQTVSGINFVDALLGVGGMAVVLAAVFGLLGWLKLRRRDVSALLEACGWALNGRMRLTHYLSKLFTQRPGVPKGATIKRQLPANPWPTLIVLLILALGVFAGIVYMMPEHFGPLGDLVHPSATDAGAPTDGGMAPGMSPQPGMGPGMSPGMSPGQGPGGPGGGPM